MKRLGDSGWSIVPIIVVVLVIYLLCAFTASRHAAQPSSSGGRLGGGSIQPRFHAFVSVAFQLIQLPSGFFSGIALTTL